MGWQFKSSIRLTFASKTLTFTRPLAGAHIILIFSLTIMKKTLFLTHILSAFIACSGILYAADDNGVVEMKGNQTITLDRFYNRFALSVTGKNNRLRANEYTTLGYENPSKIVNGELLLDNVGIAPQTGRETWEMGSNSRLDLGGSSAALVWFNITGQSVVIDKGAVNLLENQSYTLGGNLSGTADINLKEKSQLNLNGKTLSNPVTLSKDATISNGTVSGRLTLAKDASFTWSNDNLHLTGAVTLEDNSKLDLGGKTLGNTVTVKGSASFGHGIQNGALEVEGGKTLTLCGDLEGDGTITLKDQAALNLNGKTLKKQVAVSGDATIGGGTYTHGLSVGVGKKLTLSGDLKGDGTITLGNEATLVLGYKTLDKNVVMSENATIGNGTYNGALNVGGGKTLTLLSNFAGTGDITLGDGATLALNGAVLSKKVVLTKNASMGGGTFSCTLEVKDGQTLTLSGNMEGLESLLLADGATLALNNKILSKNVSVTGDASMGGGTYSGNLAVKDGKTLTLCGDLDGAGVVSLGAEAALNLGNKVLNKGISFAEKASIGNGTYNGALNVAAGQTLTLCGDLDGEGSITLAGGAALDLNGKNLLKEVVLAGDANIGAGTMEGSLTLADGVSYTWSNGGLQLDGGVILRSGSRFDLCDRIIKNATLAAASAVIENGTVSGNFTLADDVTYTWNSDDLLLTGNVTLGAWSTLNLNDKTIKSATLAASSAIIDKGTVSDNLTLANGVSYTWGGSNDLHIDGTVTLEEQSSLNLGDKTLTQSLIVAGDAVLAGSGTLDSSVVVKAQTGRLALQNVTLGESAAFFMEDGAQLDLCEAETGLGSLHFTGQSAVVDSGTLTVAAEETLTLGGDLSGTGTVALGDKATLNLGGNTLSTGISLAGDATLGGGAYTGNLTVKDGKTLNLNGDLSGTGEIAMGDNAALNLNGHILEKAVSLQGTATIGGGTHNGTISVGAGQTLSLSADMRGADSIILEDGATLNLGNHTLDKAVSLKGIANFAGGTISGDLILANGMSYTWTDNTLKLTGGVVLEANTQFDLNNKAIKAATLTANDSILANGTVTGNLTLGNGVTHTWGANNLQVSGTVTLGDNVTLSLLGATLSNNITLQGTATLDSGTLGGAVTGGGIIKTGAGKLDLKTAVDLKRLDVRQGVASVTGTADAQGSIASIQAATGSTIELAYTDATWAKGQAYRGNLVIGDGSTVTAGGEDGLDYRSNNSLTVKTGGWLEMGANRWTIAAVNKITLAGGEIAGVGGLLDFCGGANVVTVTENSSLSTAVRVRAVGSDSLAFDVAEGKQLAFTGDIVSFGQFDDNKATVYKRGAGTVVMSGSNAMTNGTIVVEAGTLKVTGGANPLGSGTVKVLGGATLNLDGEVSGAGAVILGESGPQGGDAVLELGGHTLDRAVTLEGSATIANGTLNGIVKVKDGKTLSLGGNLQGTADIAIDGGAVQLGNNTWAKSGTGQAGTGELYSMQGIGEAKGSISGHAKADAAGLTGAGEANRVQVQGMFLSTKSDFTLSHADIGGSLIDVGKGTTMYLVDVNIRPDTRLTDDAAVLNMKDTRGWLEKDVNTSVIGTETLGDETTLLMCGNNSEAITLSAGSTGVNLSCDMFNYVTLDGTNLWLDMTDIAQKNTFKDMDYFTLMFDSMDPVQEGAKALVNTGNLSVTVQLDGASYTTEAYYNSDELEGGLAPRLYFVLPAGPEPVPVPVVREVNSSEQITDPITGVDIIAKMGEGTASIFSSALMEYSGSVEVREGALNIMNVDEETKLNVANVTIAADATLGVYEGETEANEGTLTIQKDKALTAGEDATLNANLVMKAGSKLDVSTAQGGNGLIMGSEVTIESGALLSNASLGAPVDDFNAFLFDYLTGEGAPEYYYLFDSVEDLYIQQGEEVKPFTQLDFVNWRDYDMDASRVFANLDENTYALVYNWDPIHENVVALRMMPEPTTGTLSLLALCALAARRRRK